MHYSLHGEALYVLHVIVYLFCFLYFCHDFAVVNTGLEPIEANGVAQREGEHRFNRRRLFIVVFKGCHDFCDEAFNVHIGLHGLQRDYGHDNLIIIIMFNEYSLKIRFQVRFSWLKSNLT